MTRYCLVICLFCFFVVTGCVKKPTPVESVVAPQALSPLISFVSTAPPGASGWFNDPMYGNVRVVVGNEYLSALGQECKQALVHVTQSCVETIAICQDGGRWAQAPRIWGGCPGIPEATGPDNITAPHLQPQEQQGAPRGQAPAQGSERMSGRVKTTPEAVVEYKTIRSN